MPSKRNAPTQSAPSTAVPTPVPNPSNSSNPATILRGIFESYAQRTPQRTKLIDAFLGFLVVTGILQFVYCVIAGNYVCLLSPYRKKPANMYSLSLSTHFWLDSPRRLGNLSWLVCFLPSRCGLYLVNDLRSASLRIQSNPANKSEFTDVSPERFVPPSDNPLSSQS